MYNDVKPPGTVRWLDFISTRLFLFQIPFPSKFYTISTIVRSKQNWGLLWYERMAVKFCFNRWSRCWFDHFWFEKKLLHPGRLYAGTYKSPMKRKENDLNQTSRELCSMLIFRSVGPGLYRPGLMTFHQAPKQLKISRIQKGPTVDGWYPKQPPGMYKTL